MFTSSVSAYAHDRLGRVVSRNGDAFGYDTRSQVVSASVSTNAYGYSYDSAGNSIRASRNAETNLYTSNALNQYTAVAGGDGTQSLAYDADGHQKSAKPKAVPPSDRDFIAVLPWRSEERIPVTQRQLYITAYVSENGSVVAEYEYDAFGATVAQSGAMSDDFRHRFSTKPWIAALGVYDYGERLYAPELHRWLSRDPVGEEGGVNLYAMCGNDAVNGVDPLGMFSYKVPDCTYEVIVGHGLGDSVFQKHGEVLPPQIRNKSSIPADITLGKYSAATVVSCNSMRYVLIHDHDGGLVIDGWIPEYTRSGGELPMLYFADEVKKAFVAAKNAAKFAMEDEAKCFCRNGITVKVHSYFDFFTRMFVLSREQKRNLLLQEIIK